MGGERIRAGEEVEPTSRPAVIPRRLEAAELDQLRAGLAQAQAAIAELQRYSESLPPLARLESTDVLRELGVAEQTLNKMAVTALPVLGSRYQNEEQMIKDLLTSARGLVGDNPAGATVLLAQAEAKLEWFGEVIQVETGLVAAGRPPGMEEEKFIRVLDAVEASLTDFGTQTEKRGQNILAAAKLYADNASFYNMSVDSVRAERDFLLGFVIAMGEGAGRRDAYSLSQDSDDRQKLADYQQKLDDIRAQLRDSNISALAAVGEDIGTAMAALEGREEARRIYDKMRVLQEESNRLLAMLQGDGWRSVSQEEVDAVAAQYRFIATGEMPVSEEDRLAGLMDAAVEMRGAGADSDARASQEGTQEWFGQQALRLLDLGNREEVAELAIAMGRLERDAKQSEESAGSYMPEELYREILDVVSGRLALPPTAAERLDYIAEMDTYVEVAALAHNMDSMKATYSQARPRERAEETQRRQRILDALDEARSRLVHDADLDGARRIFDMASRYAEALETVEGAWRNGWAQSAELEAAIDAELAGENAGERFDRSWAAYAFTEDTRELRQGLADWGSGVARQKGVVESVLTAAERLSEAGMRAQAYELLTLASFYVDSVKRLGEWRRGKLQAVEGYDFGGMETALVALASGEAGVDEAAMRAQVVAEFNASQAVAVGNEAAELQRLARSRPEGRDVVLGALDAAKSKAEGGDVRGAWLLISYVRDYYGAAGEGRQAGWNYDQFSGSGAERARLAEALTRWRGLFDPAAIAAGYGSARDAMLDGISRASAASTEEEYQEADGRFGYGAQKVNNITGLLQRYELVLAQAYSLPEALVSGGGAGVTVTVGPEYVPAPPAPWVVSPGMTFTLDPYHVLQYDEQFHSQDAVLRSGPTLAQLLADCERAAAKGDRNAYNLATAQFEGQFQTVANRYIRAHNFETVAGQLGTIQQNIQELADVYGTLLQDVTDPLARQRAQDAVGGRLRALEASRQQLQDLLMGMRFTEEELPQAEYAAFLGKLEDERKLLATIASGSAHLQSQVELTDRYIEMVKAGMPDTPAALAAAQSADSVPGLLRQSRDQLVTARMRLLTSSSLEDAEERTESLYEMAMGQRMLALSMWRSDPVAIATSAQKERVLVERQFGEYAGYMGLHTRAYEHLLQAPGEREIPRSSMELAGVFETSVFGIPMYELAQAFSDYSAQQSQILGVVDRTNSELARVEGQTMRTSAGTTIHYIPAVLFDLPQQASDILEDMSSRVARNEKLTGFAETIAAVAAVVMAPETIAPRLATVVFGMMAVSQVVAESRTPQGVSVGTWVNLGLILATGGLYEVSNILRIAAVDAAMLGRYESALSTLRIARGFEYANLGVGLGMSGWMSFGAAEAFQAGDIETGVFDLAMVAFPLVHSAARRGSEARQLERMRQAGMENVPRPVIDEVGSTIDATIARAKAAVERAGAAAESMVTDLIRAGASPSEAFELALAAEGRGYAPRIEEERPAGEGRAYRTGESEGTRPPEERPPTGAERPPAAAPRPGEAPPQATPAITVQTPRRGGVVRGAGGEVIAEVAPTPAWYARAARRAWEAPFADYRRHRKEVKAEQQRRAQELASSREQLGKDMADEMTQLVDGMVQPSSEADAVNGFLAGRTRAEAAESGDAAALADAEAFAGGVETAAQRTLEIVKSAYARASLGGSESEIYWSLLRRLYARENVREMLREAAETDPEVARILRVTEQSVRRVAGEDTEAYLASLARQDIPAEEALALADYLETNAAATRAGATRQLTAAQDRQMEAWDAAYALETKKADLEATIEAREAEAAVLEAALHGDPAAAEARVAALNEELATVRAAEAEAKTALDALRQETGLDENVFRDAVVGYEMELAELERATGEVEKFEGLLREAPAGSEESVALNAELTTARDNQAIVTTKVRERMAAIRELLGEGGITDARWDNLAGDAAVRISELDAAGRYATQLETELATANREAGAARGADTRTLRELQRSNDRELARERRELEGVERQAEQMGAEIGALEARIDELGRTVEENAPLAQTDRVLGRDRMATDVATEVLQLESTGRIPPARLVAERYSLILRAKEEVGSLPAEGQLQQTLIDGLRDWIGAEGSQGRLDDALLKVLKSDSMVEAVRAAGYDVAGYRAALESGTLAEVLTKLSQPWQRGEGVGARTIDLRMGDLSTFIGRIRDNVTIADQFSAVESLRARSDQIITKLGEDSGMRASDTAPLGPAAGRWARRWGGRILSGEPFYHWGGAQTVGGVMDALPGARGRAVWRNKGWMVLQLGTWAAMGYATWYYLVSPYLDELAQAPDIRAGRAQARRDYQGAPEISEENALFLRTAIGGRFYHHIPALLARPAAGPTSDAERRTLMQRREIVPNPQRINELLTDGRQMAAQLENINRLLADSRSGNARASSEARDKLEELLGTMGISLAAVLALGKDSLEIEDMFDLRVDDWVKRGVVDRYAEFAVEFDCKALGMNDNQMAVAVPFLVDHVDAYIFLWKSLRDGYIPASYIDDAILALAQGNTYAQLMAQATAERPIETLLQEELTSAGFYLSTPIVTDSFLEVIDSRAATDPSFAPVAERILQQYKNDPEAMAKLNAFMIDGLQENLYGDMEALAARIAAAPDPAAVLAEARDMNGTAPYFVGSSQLSDIDARLLDRPDLARFVAQHSTTDNRGRMSMEAGLLKWLVDNGTGDNPHLVKRDGTSSALEVLVSLAANRRAAEMGTQAIADYANRQADDYKTEGLWKGPTPSEAAAVAPRAPAVHGGPTETRPARRTGRPRISRAAPEEAAAAVEAQTTEAEAMQVTGRPIAIPELLSSYLQGGRSPLTQVPEIKAVLETQFGNDVDAMLAFLYDKLYESGMRATDTRREVRAQAGVEKDRLQTAGLSAERGAGGLMTFVYTPSASARAGLQSLIVELLGIRPSPRTAEE